MRPSIKVQYPDGRSESYELVRERTVVGRGAKADIRIIDNRVSRTHCAIEVQGDRVYVVDLGGSNGTWIGGTKILANVPEPFPPEAIVYVGPAEIRLDRSTSGFNPQQDLESQVYAPVAPQPPPAHSSAEAPASAQYPQPACLSARHKPQPDRDQ